MGQQVTLTQLRSWLLLYADRIDEKEAYLTELDAAIGDADHGINMRSGMTKLRQRLLEVNQADGTGNGDNAMNVSAFLRTVAMTLIRSIGGAAGPLYGSFFLNASRDAYHEAAIDLDELTHIFRSGLDGVIQRGKAQPGDKTMIDALEPAVVAMETAATTGANVNEAMSAACDAAKAGMKQTVGLEARKGRASYLGPRSIGHQDPGATSSYMLIQAAAETFGQDDQAEQ